MSKRTIGIIAIVVGLVLVLVALLANTLGISTSNVFGWKKTILLVAGLVVMAGGAWWGWLRKSK
jgi:hypothetical protein